MAKRSTRNKIRFQAKKVIDKLEGCMEHLKRLDDLAEGESEIIDKNLPTIVMAFEILHDNFVRFRKEL